MASNTTTEPTSLTMDVLRKITNNFSEERAIGQGSYGKVYRGVHDNGEEIAVKLLYNNMQAIDGEQFQHEFHNLTMLKHQNIIRLVGYCYETQHQHMEFKGRNIFVDETYKAFCFEYMHKGSLQKHISDECHGLDWHTRYKIIKGTCEGLKYLHEGFKEPLYHLDLKPDNILLDENMVPKLADFGLSKFYSEGKTRVTKSHIGTIGYMPPEYLFQQLVSKKLDIFSLGVVMTKIITGPRGHFRSDEMPYQECIDQVYPNWRNRLEATCSSPGPLEAYCEQVNICIEIALSCTEHDRQKRPNIVDIIHKLNETETVIDKALSLSGSSLSWMPGHLDTSLDISVHLEPASETQHPTTANQITGLVTFHCPSTTSNEITGSVALDQAALAREHEAYEIPSANNGTSVSQWFQEPSLPAQYDAPPCFCFLNTVADHHVFSRHISFRPINFNEMLEYWEQNQMCTEHWLIANINEFFSAPDVAILPADVHRNVA